MVNILQYFYENSMVHPLPFLNYTPAEDH